ncbi:Intradiol ring-cleavage dioxygenase [Calycina marina]|uniref:Intradiol ring-cleavage dioxygenase n=1 Tax=Calycina marina TaxID=1763456 RepID=A0A9P7Z775_9HELO|nr:Intradiol ring-cleavage dioxygenase [Calycina marina]
MSFYSAIRSKLSSIRLTLGNSLGSFPHIHEAEHTPNEGEIEGDPEESPLLVLCTLKGINGVPIAGATIDVWETDSKGFYDVKYAEQNDPDGRAVLTSDDEGNFFFKAIVPVPYPIPHDGPCGKLLTVLKRHPYRPSHMHFMFEKDDYDPLITALYLKNHPYESSDAVFGVKKSLLVELSKVEDKHIAQKHSVELGCALMTYDFILVTEEATKDLRQKLAAEVMESEGKKVRFLDGLPVPYVN